MTELTAPRSRAALPASITLGFAAAVVMWTIGFLLHLPGIQTPAPMTAGILGVTLAAFGFLAGRAAGVKAAVGAGLVAGLVCLLLVGSVIAEESGTNELRPNWALVIGGWLLTSAVAAGLAGLLGALRRAPDAKPRDWHATFALIAALSVLPLIVIGGLVTSYGAGLAVPDWPNTYGSNMFLYPLSKMTGGIYYEHAHRLFGALVGLTTMVFMVYTLIVDRRAWVKALVVALFVLVCVQGVLGGLRVTEVNLGLAIFHGVTAQLFFAAMCAMAAVCSTRWKSGEPRHAAAMPGSPRTLSAVLCALLFIQLVFGAMLRHLGPSEGAHAMMSHIANAVIVLIVLIGAGVRAPAAMPGDRLFRRLGMGTMHAGITQFLLGGVALWAVLMYAERETPVAVETIVTTAHQALGAVLLAFAATLFAWSRRLVLQKGKSRAVPA